MKRQKPVILSMALKCAGGNIPLSNGMYLPPAAAVILQGTLPLPPLHPLGTYWCFGPCLKVGYCCCSGRLLPFTWDPPSQCSRGFSKDGGAVEVPATAKPKIRLGRTGANLATNALHPTTNPQE